MDSNKPIGFVVIGLGMGKNRARMVAKTEGAKLVGVVDLREDLAQKVANDLGCEWHTDFRFFIDRSDVNVAFVMTPSGSHADVAIPFLKAGKNVIVTKPMEVSLDRADEMILTAEQNGCLLAVDFEMRFLDESHQIRQAVNDGLFGKLILLEGRLKWFRSQDYYTKSGWRGTWRYDGGGSLANQTIHLIDQLIWLGGEVEAVQSAYIDVFAHNIETEDLGTAILRFRNGAVGTVLGTTTFPQDLYSTVEVHGSQGGAVWNVTEQVKWFFRDKNQAPLQVTSPHPNVVANMVASICENAPLLCDGYEGRKSLELLTAIYKSAQINQSVNL